MPHATVNGREVHFREAGEGYPLVLIHGFTGNSRNWALTVPALRDRFRPISVDLRGHGLSHKPVQREDYTIEAMAGEVFGLLEQLGVRECYLTGHSMGGMVAQRSVLDHPQLVRALVLVDTAAAIEDMDGYAQRHAERQRLVDIAREQGMEAVFEEQMRLTAVPDAFRANPQYIQVWRDNFLMTSREAYMYGAHGMASRQPLTEELRRVSVPALIICGEQDTPFLRAAHIMHERIVGSRLEIIPGAGHGPQMERPAEFNRILLEFLAKVHESAPVS